MCKRVTLDGKDPVGRQQAEDAAECIGISTQCSRQIRSGAWRLVQHVSDSEVGSDMQTAWQGIGTCQIQYGLDRIHLSLGELLVDLHHDLPSARATVCHASRASES